METNLCNKALKQSVSASRQSRSIGVPSSNCAVSDVDLIAEVMAGHEAALAILHARHGPLLRSVIYRIVNNWADVEEVLQDLFLYIWNHVAAYSAGKGLFIGWLITIARRRSVDRVRRRSSCQRAMTRFEESSRHLGVVHHSSWFVDKEVRHHELRKLIDEHLCRLPVLQSEVVRLSFFNGLSQREIARHLSLPLGTVKTRVELGMRKLSYFSLLRQAA